MNQQKSYWRWVTHLSLLLSGWKPWRRVWEQLKLPTSLSPFSAAERILTEFGNLKFGDKNEYALLDPSVGERVEKEIRGYERVIGRRLFLIGVWCHQDSMYLLVDVGGIIYTLDHELRPFASSFNRAIDYLVRLKWSPNDLSRKAECFTLPSCPIRHHDQTRSPFDRAVCLRVLHHC
jgi:hypothetical protein